MFGWHLYTEKRPQKEVCQTFLTSHYSYDQFFYVATSAVMVTDKSPEEASPIIPGPLGPTSPPKEYYKGNPYFQFLG